MPKGEAVRWACAITHHAIFRLGLWQSRGGVLTLISLLPYSFLPTSNSAFPEASWERGRDRGKQGMEGEKSQLFPDSLAISWLTLEKGKSLKWIRIWS